MSFGVTPQGFVRPSLQDIQSKLRERIRDLFGPVDLSPNEPFGQLLGIWSTDEDEIWSALEAVYLSQYPNSSSGRSLDGAVQLTGITRLAASRSLVTAVLIGVPGTTIDAGSQASVDGTGELFETLTPTQLNLNDPDVIQLFIEINDIQPETNYVVTIDGVPYTYESSVNPDQAEILEGIRDALPSQVTGELSGNGLFIRSEDLVIAYQFALSSNLTLEQVGLVKQMRALETGPIQAFSGTLNTIETAVSGWEAVVNYVDGTPGRSVETDESLRIRRLESLQIGGAGTVEAIRARLLDQVDDVVAVSIIENRSDTVDGDGRPPHSFEAVVSGGLDQDVADFIWLVKPAGIETAGNIELVVVDSLGGEQLIRFSRPIDVYVWINVSVNINGVGTWPSDGAQGIRDSLVNYGESLGVGDNIIYQALFGPIYQIPGIESVDVEVAITSSPAIAPDPGDFVQTNISVGSNELSLWAQNRIEVTVNE